jgi:hypothetical protein
MTEKPMDENEAREILVHLARNGPPTAQIGAIKTLRDMDRAAKEEAEAEREARAVPPGFEGLYDDEFSMRRRNKKGDAAA